MRAKEEFWQLDLIAESKEKLEEADRKIEAIQKTKYASVIDAMKNANDNKIQWYTIVHQLEDPGLNSYRDVNQLRDEAKKRLDECIAIDKEKEREKEFNKKRDKVDGVTTIIVIIIVVAVSILSIIGKNFM